MTEVSGAAADIQNSLGRLLLCQNKITLNFTTVHLKAMFSNRIIEPSRKTTDKMISRD